MNKSRVYIEFNVKDLFECVKTEKKVSSGIHYYLEYVHQYELREIFVRICEHRKGRRYGIVVVNNDIYADFEIREF